LTLGSVARSSQLVADAQALAKPVDGAATIVRSGAPPSAEPSDEAASAAASAQPSGGAALAIRFGREASLPVGGGRRIPETPVGGSEAGVAPPAADKALSPITEERLPEMPAGQSPSAAHSKPEKPAHGVDQGTVEAAVDGETRMVAEAAGTTTLLSGDIGLTRANHGPAAASANAPSPNATMPAGPPVPLAAVPVEIGAKALAGVNRFEIRLDPEELGRVQVRLDIDDAGRVKAHLAVDRADTLALLQRDAKTLERAFEQAGLRPSEGGIDLSLRDPQGQARGQQHRDGQPHHPTPPEPKPQQASSAQTETPARIIRGLWGSVRGVDRRV
jgi:flagellar hook-length control protein FliK